MLRHPMRATFTLLLGAVCPSMEEYDLPISGDKVSPDMISPVFCIKVRLFMILVFNTVINIFHIHVLPYEGGEFVILLFLKSGIIESTCSRFRVKAFS